MFSKSALARRLGVSRSSLYYRPRQPAKDDVLRDRVLAARKGHPGYGQRRLALTLGVSTKVVARIVHKYGIALGPARRRRGARRILQPSAVSVPDAGPDSPPVRPDSDWVAAVVRLPHARHARYRCRIHLYSV